MRSKAPLLSPTKPPPSRIWKAGSLRMSSLCARLLYYCGPGGSGVANPEPESVEGVGLEELLRNAAAGAAGAAAPANETVTTQLSALATDIETVIREQVPD